MAATKQLRKENEELRDQGNQLKEKLEEISHDLNVASKRNVVLPEQTKSIEFLTNDASYKTATFAIFFLLPVIR